METPGEESIFLPQRDSLDIRSRGLSAAEKSQRVKKKGGVSTSSEREEREKEDGPNQEE